MEHKYKRLISDILIFGLGALGSKLIIFLLLPLYTNVLSDSEYGIADLVFTAGQLLLPIISVAIFNGLLRYGLIPSLRCEDALRCATVVFVVGSITTVVLTPLAGLYEPISEWKWYLCLYTISSFASQNTFVYLKVKDKNKLYSILSITQALLLVACNVLFLVILKSGVQGYLLSSIIAFAGTAIIAFFVGGMHTDLKRSSYSNQLMKKMVLYSVPFILNDISWWIIHSSDKIMIEWMLGSAILGIYTVASKIPSLINAVASIFSQAWSLSSVKEYDSSNDTTFYSNVFQYFVIALFGICICVIAVTKPFMRIYVGSDFFEAWHYVPLLLVSATFSAISAFAGSMYGAMKKSKNIMTTTLISSTANIVINYVFIQIYGVWGVVIGTIMAYVMNAVLRLYDIHKYVKIDYHIRKLSFLSILAIVEAIMVGLDFHVLWTSITCLIIYFIGVSKELRHLISVVLTKVKSSKSRND